MRPSRSPAVSARAATAAMSRGSMTETATPANGAATVSPCASWSRHCSVFDMKLLGCRNVHARPEARIAASDSRW